MATKTVEGMIDAALKALTVPDLGDSRLTPEQAAQFVRIVERESVLLGQHRRLNLQRDRRNIDRTGFSDRILTEPAAESEAYTTRQQPDVYTNELVAQKARGAASISDEALMENIEQEGFESTLLDMIASRAALDLEELLLAGDTGSADAYLALVDGWLVTAQQQVTELDFDPADIEDVFDTCMAAVDDKYLRNRDRWRFWVSWDADKAYRDALKARNTSLGDTAVVGREPLVYEGFGVEVVPLMPSGQLLFTNIDNAVYGIRTDVEIEPERKADADRWDFHVRVRGDANYEDENAAVAASGITA